jgi:stearoyl-CoA desaturase (delta-9 desaturase)
MCVTSGSIITSTAATADNPDTNNNSTNRLTPNGYISDREQDQEKKEFELSREYKWFSVKFYDRRTLSGDRTRYLFVDQSRYGIVVPNVIFFVFAHIAYFISWRWIWNHAGSAIYCYWFSMMISLGITAGVHRLWSHKSYTASLPLRIILACFFTAVGQNDIFTWCRDHRLHHKFTETDADPHNSRRGGFFAHVGWLLTKKHPDVLIKGKTIDNSDLLNDPVVYWNRKFYVIWYILLRVFWPIMLPWYWGVETHILVLGNYAMYVANLHSTWFVNSAAHIFGDRPYNDKIQPRENWFVALFGYNEGFHNYHHQFPWDWRIAEHGISFFDPGKWFIASMAAIGLASNLKQASPSLIKKTKDKVRMSAAEHQHDSSFYVHDHPYFSPHHYADAENEMPQDRIPHKSE